MKIHNIFNNLSDMLKRGVLPVVVASATVVAFSLPQAAVAQDNSRSGSAGALLEEIVTTARKKSDAEAVQDVPVAVTAFGEAQIDALFVKKITDLSYLVPNVQMEEIGTFPGVQSFSFRGQGINSSIPSVDPTVGVFVDGIFLGTSFGVVMDTFDLEGVEVLRGPQGMLFGRNVTGGAVILRNKRPTGEYGLRVRAGATADAQYNLGVAVEGSLIDDVLAAKMVFLIDDDEGYFNALTLGRKFGKMRTRLYRPSIKWTPNDIFEMDMIVEHGQSNGDGAPWAIVASSNPAFASQRGGTLPNFSTNLNDAGYTNIEWTQVTNEINIAEVGNGTLTNIAGWRGVDANSAPDVDGLQLPVFFVPGETVQSQWSNELRWNGNVTDRWETTVGMYYFNQTVNYREGRLISGGALTIALGGDMDAKNFGAFWSNDFFLNDSIVINAGLRYTSEDKSGSIIDSSAAVGGPCFDVVTFSCPRIDLSGEWDNVTPKIGIQYNFGEASQVYAFYSKGFRSGGFNFRNARPDSIPPGPTKEEENNTFEVGLKSTFADGRVRLNIAAFHNSINDLQREINIADPFVLVLQATINAGDATITGVEADVVALLSDNFSVNLSYGVQDGKWDSFNPFVPAFEGALRNAGLLGANEPLFGPDFVRLAPTNWSAGLSWDIPVGESTLNIASSYSFRERHPYDDTNRQYYEDAERFNASITLFSGSGKWDLSLYGKNLGDEPYWGNLTGIGSLGIVSGPMAKGEVTGLEFNYRVE